MSNRKEILGSASILYFPGVPMLDERSASGEAEGSVESIVAEARASVMRSDSAILEVLITEGKLVESQIEREPGSGKVFIRTADGKRMTLAEFMRILYPKKPTLKSVKQ